jgi:serine/threonine protein kinase
MPEGTAVPVPVEVSAVQRADAAAVTYREVPLVAPPPPRPGKKLPEVPGYELLRELGRGGMGVVYLARQTKLKRLVALKMILAGVLSKEEDLARFQAEAQIVSQLQHPNIVQVYEIGEHDQYDYYSMEFVPGGTLARRVQLRPLSPREAAQVVQALAQAMQVAHDQGIIHRDLKPANVLLAPKSEARSSKSGSEKTETTPSSGPDFAWSDVEEMAATELRMADFIPKVTDFGLAKRLQAKGLTQTGVVLGTPEYMAPEQALGLPNVQGPAVDIYALGVILYELLTGRPPFKGCNPMDTIQQVITEEVVPVSRLQPKTPRDLQTICQKCLRKEALHRYRSARELAEDLQCFLDGQPIQARPAGPVERTIKWARRKPALAGLLATVLLAVVLLSVAVVQLLRTNAAEARQRMLAEENARLAKEAVDNLSLAVIAEPPFNEEPMRAARKKLLEKALPFYEKFKTLQSDDRKVLEDAAKHHFHLAMIIEEIGRKDQAQPYYAEALRLWEQLVAAHPQQVSYRQQQVQTLIHLGLLHLHLGHHDEAATCCQKAQQLCQQLTAVSPQDTLSQKLQADATFALGRVQASTGKIKPAEQSYRQALQSYQQLATHQPKDMALQAQVAATYNRLGELLEPNHNRLAAIELLKQALTLYQQVTAAQPQVSTYQADLALVHNNLGTAYRGQRTLQGFATAEKHVQQELLILERLATQYPDVVDYQARQMMAWTRRGSLQMEDPQGYAASEESLRKALAINQRVLAAQPHVLEYQKNLVWELYFLGVLGQKQRHTTAAVAWCGQAEQQLLRLLERYPKEVALREQRRLLHRIWALALEEGGRYREALNQWEQAQNFANPKRVEFLHHQGVCYARLGDYAAAGKLITEITNHHVQHGIVAVELARIHAICLAGSTDPAVQDRYAQGAIQALRRYLLRDPEFKNHLPHQKTLQEDPDFAVLRRRPDFQALLQEMQPSYKP